MIVKFTVQANIQLGAILDYILERDPSAADRMRKRFERACDQLSVNPLLGRRQTVEGVRRKIVHPGGYLMYYRVNGVDKIVEIIAISHPAQRRSFDDA